MRFPHPLEGDDTIIAGRGDDLIISHSATTATIYGGEGNDTISASNAVVYGGPGIDVIEMLPGSLESPATATAYGGPGNDLMTAPDGYATLFGGEGDDTLSGGAGTVLLGEDGNDDLTIFGNFSTARGGPGDDILRAQVRIAPLEVADAGEDVFWYPDNSGLVLRGGQGNDTFVVEVDPRATLDADRTAPVIMAAIVDFAPGNDTLTVRIADAPLSFAPTLVFQPVPTSSGGELIGRDNITTAVGLTFDRLSEGTGGSHTDIVFATGADTHDLVVRLNGVAQIDPALVSVSAEGKQIQILRAAEPAT